MAEAPVQRLTVGAGAALLVLAVFGAVAFASVSRLTTQQEVVVEANSAINRIDDVMNASSEAERAGAAYMLTGAPDALTAYETARSQIEDALDELRSRAEDRPRVRAVLDTLGPLIGARIGTINASVAARRRGGSTDALAAARADSARATRGGMLPLLQRMREEELTLLGERTRLMARDGQTSRMVVLVGSIIAFLLVAIVLRPSRARTENGRA
jgi:CHASE3 domain sensor protein